MEFAPSLNDPTALDNDLWRFALSFYASEGVAQACVTLQNALDLDVNILIFAIFAALQRGIVLSGTDLAAVDNLVGDWRKEIVEHLRQLRTRLKAGPAPAPSAVTDRLRNRIKAIELDSEQVELAMLAAWLEHRTTPHNEICYADRIPMQVTRHFLPGLSTAARPDIAAALNSLAEAIRDIASPSS